MKNVMKSIGQPHYLRYIAEGVTSTTTYNNPLIYRFMPSLDNSSTYSWPTHPSAGGAGWSSITYNAWGGVSYSSYPYPYGYKKYLWCHTYMRVIFDNVAENINMKLWFLRKSKAYSDDTTVIAVPTDPEEPVDQQLWHVLHERKIVFDGPTNDTAAQHREFDFFFPFNRLIETATKATANTADDWLASPINGNDYMHMVIVSDDASATGDGEYVEVKVYLEHKIVELD